MTDVRKKFDFNLALKIFFIIAVSGFGVYVLLAVIFACVAPHLLNGITATTLFSDFAETLSYALCPNPYNGDYGFHSIYPPLSFLIFYPFTWFCQGALNEYSAGNITLAELSANAGFIVSFLLYYIINLAIIMFVVAKFTKLKGKNLFYLLSIIFCFGPLLFEFVRANNTLTVCTFTLLFFFFNSRNKIWMREVSYVFLAGAICMKIYPIFIMFYILWRGEKWEKLWGVLKVLAYTLVVVFVSFLFIEGGFSNIPILLSNVTGFSSGGATTWGSNVSFDTIVYYLCLALSTIFGGADMSIPHTILSTLLRYGLVVLAFVLPLISFKSKKYKEFVTLAVGTYLLFPGVCNGYCLTVMIIPFITMLLDWNNMKFWEKIFYTVCYGLIICPIFYTYGFFLTSAIAVAVIVIKSVVDIIRDDVRIFKDRKNQDTSEKIVDMLKQWNERENSVNFKMTNKVKNFFNLKKFFIIESKKFNFIRLN